MATHAIQVRDIVNQTLQMCLDYFGTGYIAGRTWTRAKVIIAINQALLEWCRRTGFLRKEDTVSLTEDTKTYTFPDDCLQLLGVAFYDGNARAWVSEPIAITDRDIIGLEIAGSSVPTKFFLQFLNYDQFGFQPNVGDDYTAYLTFARSHVYITEEAWTLTEDDISFDSGSKEIRSAGADFDVDAFPEGATVTVSGTAHNDGDFTVSSTATTTSVITVDESVTTEVAGADVTLTSSVTGLNYPEDAIPPWFHKDIKFGAAKILLSQEKGIRVWKKDYVEARWNAVCDRMRAIKTYHGPDEGLYAL